MCARCSAGFFFNQRGICVQVSPNCKNFVEQTGQCTACYFGFELVNGNCVVSVNDISLVDQNCARFV